MKRPIIQSLRRATSRKIADFADPKALRQHLRDVMRKNWLDRNEKQYPGYRTWRSYREWGRKLAVALGSKDCSLLAQYLDDDMPTHIVNRVRHVVENALVAGGYVRCVYSGRYYPEGDIIETNEGYNIAECNIEAAGYRYCEDINGYSSRYAFIHGLEIFVTREHASANYYLDRGSSRWYESEDDVPPPEPSNNGPVFEYNEYYGRKIGSGAKYNLGFEMEMEFPGEDEKYDYANEVTERFGVHAVHCKRDGSLGEYGVETVTGYGDYDDMAKIVDGVCEIALSYHGLSHQTTTCGHHISISRQNMTVSQIARFVAFFNLPENQGFLSEFARRKSEQWARVDGHKGTDDFISTCERTERIPRDSKYEAVNVGHSSHLEVRIFKGNLRAATVKARLALVRLVAEYCEAKLAAKDLRFDKFLEWVKATDYSSMKEAFFEYIENRKIPTAVC